MITMWWLQVLLAGSVVLASDPDGVENERQWLTWAQVLGGEPPRRIESVPAEPQSLNAISDSDNKDFQYNNDDYDSEYDYAYADDYDETFFDNPDYIYVDTEDENYVPPKVEEPGEVPQTADRRTLDFLYHLFNDQYRNGNSNDGRPSRDSAKPRRPSLIEAVFTTIDNHIVEDLREWSTYPAQRDAQAANTEPASNAGEPASLQQVSPDNDIVLVTDEQGHQHVVTINDIVTSLGHLDERTLTNLLLSEPSSPNDRSSDIQFNPSPNFVTAETQNVPVVLGTQKIGQVGVQRPARHTGPTNTHKEEGEEVYVVQDENGKVQLVTLDNIISSLALLDEDSLSSILFEDSVIPSIVPPTSLNSVSSGVSKSPVAPTAVQAPTAKPVEIPAVELPDNKPSSEPEAPKKSSPSVSTDYNGNLRVLAHPGSVTVDLNDLSWHANNEEPEEEEEEPEKPAPVFIGGSLVETDDNGDIYITPDPDRPFTLDIHNIIALAEQADTPVRPAEEEAGNFSEEEEEPEEEADRGHEILSYLAGVENFFPAAILPRPIQSTISNAETAAQNHEDPSGVNFFRSSLLQALGQQRPEQPPTIPQPVVQPLIQRLVQPVVQPIVQPIVQAVSQQSYQSSSSGGIGATLSRLISNLVGQSTPQVKTVPQVVEETPEQEFIKLVVRKQAQNSVDTHFGDVTIPLPQAIHFQPTNTRPRQTVVSQISSRVDVPSPLQGLSPGVRRSLQLQARNVPKFIPPGARAISAAIQPTNLVSARSDSGPVIRVDNTADDTHNLRPAIKPTAIPASKLRTLIRQAARRPRPSATVRVTNKPAFVKPVARPVAKPTLISRQTSYKPLSSATPSVTKELTPSLTSILQALPPTVLASIRRQAQNADLGSPQEVENEPSEIEEQPESPPTSQRDRSSYATLPEYPSGGGGYGYGPEVGYKGSDNPWLDIYLLADLTKVHKIGDTNHSVKSPIIGDPAYFVKTRHHGYHR